MVDWSVVQGSRLRNEIRSLVDDRGYQPIYLGSYMVSPGYRDCEDRWRIIKPHIGGSVLDIGSHYGYFVYKVLTETDSTVLSIEVDHRQAAIQKLMLRANNLVANVRVVRFTPYTDVDPVDTILFLAVVHYFSPGEVPRVIKRLRELCKTLIIEFPNAKERVAQKPAMVQNNIPRLLKHTFSNVELIGETHSPESKSIKRDIYKCYNS